VVVAKLFAIQMEQHLFAVMELLQQMEQMKIVCLVATQPIPTMRQTLHLAVRK
jgi:hypothetical protein